MARPPLTSPKRYPSTACMTFLHRSPGMAHSKAALGGWEVGGIVSLNSGTPTTPDASNDPLGLGNAGADQFGPIVRLAGCNPVN